MRLPKNGFLYLFYHMHGSGGTTVREHILRNYDKREIVNVHLNASDPFYNVKTGAMQVMCSIGDMQNYLNSLTAAEKARIRVMLGHHVYQGIHEGFPRIPRYVTLVRDPVEQTLSLHRYANRNIEAGKYGVPGYEWLRTFFGQGGKPLALVDWVRTLPEPYNPILMGILNRFLRMDIRYEDASTSHLEMAKQALDTFYFLGILENPRDFLFLCHLLRFRKFLPNSNVSGSSKFEPHELQEAHRLLRDRTRLDLELYAYAVKLNAAFKQRNDAFLRVVRWTGFKRFLLLPLGRMNHNLWKPE